MAEVTKVNPAIEVRSRSFMGKTLDMYTLDIANHAVDMDNEMDPGEAFDIVLRTIGTMATIVGYSENRTDGSNNGQLIDFYVEGDFGTDTYDGTNSETFAAHLEDLIQGLGSTVGANNVDLSSATITQGTGFPLFANVA